MNSLKLADIMTPDPAVTSPDEAIISAFVDMRNYGVRHLPVQDGDSIIGMLSDRDIQRSIEVKTRSFGTTDRVTEWHLDPNLKVRDFMSAPAHKLPHSATINDAIKLLLNKKISSVLVEKNGKICGIVTTDDLLRAFATPDDDQASEAPLSL